jgi:hypothetical protein
MKTTIHFDHLSLCSYQKDKCFKRCRENHARGLYSMTFSKNRAIYEIMWKNVVERGRPEMISCAWALHAGYLRLQHALTICNVYCF